MPAIITTKRRKESQTRTTHASKDTCILKINQVRHNNEKTKYSEEFKQESVKQVADRGYSVSGVSKRFMTNELFA